MFATLGIEALEGTFAIGSTEDSHGTLLRHFIRAHLKELAFNFVSGRVLAIGAFGVTCTFGAIFSILVAKLIPYILAAFPAFRLLKFNGKRFFELCRLCYALCQRVFAEIRFLVESAAKISFATFIFCIHAN